MSCGTADGIALGDLRPDPLGVVARDVAQAVGGEVEQVVTEPEGRQVLELDSHNVRGARARLEGCPELLVVGRS